MSSAGKVETSVPSCSVLLATDGPDFELSVLVVECSERTDASSLLSTSPSRSMRRRGELLTRGMLVGIEIQEESRSCSLVIVKSVTSLQFDDGRNVRARSGWGASSLLVSDVWNSVEVAY